MKLRWFTPFVFALSLFLLTLLLLTPAKAQTPTATPNEATPTSWPASRGLIETSLGLSDDDCSDLYGMTHDQAAERLYLLCHNIDQEATDGLLVLDSRTDEQIAFIHLDEAWFPEYARATDSPSFLLLDASAQRLYLRSPNWLGVLVLDTATLTKVRWLPVDGTDSIVAADQDRLYVQHTDGGLTIYRASDFSRVAHASEVKYLAYNPVVHHLYVVATKDTNDLELQIRNGDDLTLEITLPLSGAEIEASALNSQTDHLYILTKQQQPQVDGVLTKRQLLVVDGQTQVITTHDQDFLTNLSTYLLALWVDEATNRLYIIDPFSANWLIVDGQTLSVLKQYQLQNCLPSYKFLVTFDAAGRLLLALPGNYYSPGSPVVYRYDPVTGRPDQPLLLGHRLMAVTVHPEDGRLYTVDYLGALNVLDGTSLQPLNRHPNLLEVCQGNSIYLALDPGRNRLFMGQPGAKQTLVLDPDTLELLDQLPLVGPMTVDTVNGRLFMIERAADQQHDEVVRTFDTATLAGLQPANNSTGQIAGTGPGVGPQSYISDLIFDEPTERLFLQITSISGTSGGSCGGCMWNGYVVYNPDTLTPLDAPKVVEGARMEYLTFSPDGQRTYIAFQHNASNSSGNPEFYRLGIFDRDNRLIRRVNGLFGSLAADAHYVYLLQDQYLLALDAQALETPNRPYLMAVLPLEQAYQHLALVQDRLYLWGQRNVATISTADLVAHHPTPPLGGSVVEAETDFASLPSLELVGHAGGAPGPVAVQEHYAYAAFGSELAVLDISEPTQPRRVGYVTLPNEVGEINHLAVAGNYVYIATQRAGLRVIDVATPTAPVEIGFYAPNLPRGAKAIYQVAVAGQYAYVAAGERGLRVIDVSNPATPIEIGFYEFDANSVTDVDVIKAANRIYAYVLVEEPQGYVVPGQLHLLNLSDPTQPTEIDWVGPPVKAPYLSIEDHTLYLTAYDERSEILLKTLLDISAPTKPVEVEFNPSPEHSYQAEVTQSKAAIAGEYAFVSTIDGLKVMDISDATKPQEVAIYRARGGSDKLAIIGNHAYLPDEKGISIIDISDPSDPKTIGFYQFDPNRHGAITDIAAADERLYLLDEEGLRVLSVSTPTDLVEIGFWPISSTLMGEEEIAVVEDYIYITIMGCCDAQGLLILNVSDPTHPVQQGFFPMFFPKYMGEMFRQDQSLYVYTGDEWHILDISNPIQPALVNASPPPLFIPPYSTYFRDNFDLAPNLLTPQRFYLFSDYYVTDGQAGLLRVVDLKDRFNPITMSAYKTFGTYGANVMAVGQYLYMAAPNSGLFIFQLN